MLSLAKVTYKDTKQKKDTVIQMQLVEYFRDAIKNQSESYRSEPTVLVSAFPRARRNQKLFKR